MNLTFDKDKQEGSLTNVIAKPNLLYFQTSKFFLIKPADVYSLQVHAKRSPKGKTRVGAHFAGEKKCWHYCLTHCHSALL